VKRRKEPGTPENLLVTQPRDQKIARTNPRNKVLQIRLNSEELAALERIAAARDLSVSAIAREQLLKLVTEPETAGDPLVQLIAATDRLRNLADEVREDLADTYEIRSDVVWPSGLSLPARPPKLVYLDTMGYINLAKVALGTAPPGYGPLLEACRRSRAQGRALFVLSSTHVLEVFNIIKAAQRRSLVAAMEEVSGFNYLLGRPQIQRLEVEAAFAEIAGVTPPVRERIDLVGPNLFWAFGMRGGLVIHGAPDPDAAAEQLRQLLGSELDGDAMASITRWTERELLAGPEDHNDPELRSLGYTLDGWRRILEQRAQLERDLVPMLDADPQIRRRRLRDVINAREMFHELNGAIAAATTAANTTIGDVVGRDRTKARDFNDMMPSTRVAVSMKVRYHRDPQHRWTANDIQDIDALAIAVPYCDAVFTDKAARNQLVRSPELAVFGTFLPRNPEQLTEWLSDLTAPE
jgi:hypothetical protein